MTCGDRDEGRQWRRAVNGVPSLNMSRSSRRCTDAAAPAAADVVNALSRSVRQRTYASTRDPIYGDSSPRDAISAA